MTSKMSPPLSPLRLAVLISGGGTTLANLLAKIDEGSLDAEVRIVITSNPAARGIDIALQAGIPVEIIERSEYRDLAEFSRATFDPIRKADVHLVAMGGYLKLVPIPDDFAGRVVNIHPALIPAFCGKGFYGHHVHEAVLEYGAKISGCTVHFVDNQYDHGPIILQHVVPVEEEDTPDTLAARVFDAECEAYPAALRLFAAGRLKIDGRVVHVASE